MNASALLLLTTCLFPVQVAGWQRSASPVPVGESTRDALRSLEVPDLCDLRAAGAAQTPGPDGNERSELRQLESRHVQQLAERRAGDLSLSNRDLTTVLLVIGILVGLAILL